VKSANEQNKKMADNYNPDTHIPPTLTPEVSSSKESQESTKTASGTRTTGPTDPIPLQEGIENLNKLEVTMRDQDNGALTAENQKILDEMEKNLRDAWAPLPESNWEWTYLGTCDVDAGLLMIGDPCYFIGTEEDNTKQMGWGDWISMMEDEEADFRTWRLKSQIPHDLGHPGKGVVAGTVYGDGSYPVYGLYDKTYGRAKAMFVFTERLTPAEIGDLGEFLRQRMKDEDETADD